MLQVTLNIRGRKVIATMFKGKPLADAPKTYNNPKVISHSIGDNYNSSIMTLYTAKDNTLRYEIYRDGCFWPYYGKITIDKYLD